jgi:hypothetical protein
MIRFVPSKIGGGGTVHSDRGTSSSRFSSVGIINSERRHVNFIIVIGPGGGWPITEVVPTVQPKRRVSQISNPR